MITLLKIHSCINFLASSLLPLLLLFPRPSHLPDPADFMQVKNLLHLSLVIHICITTRHAPAFDPEHMHSCKYSHSEIKAFHISCFDKMEDSH